VPLGFGLGGFGFGCTVTPQFSQKRFEPDLIFLENF
jgi:hypothetical protein